MSLSRRALPALFALVSLACDPTRPPRVYPEPPGECPAWEPVVGVDSSCDLAPCRVNVTRQGCELSIQLTGCKTTELKGQLDLQGNLHFSPNAQLGPCEGVAPTPGAIASFRCESQPHSCRYDLYPAAPLLPLNIERIKLVSGAPSIPAGAGVDNLVGYTAHAGYLTTLLLRGSELLVVTHGGQYRDLECLAAERASTIARIDRQRFVLTQTVSAPRCLYALAPDPTNAPGFIGFTGGAQLEVHRFDERAQVVATASVSLPPGRDDYAPVAAVTAGGGLYAVYTDRNSPSRTFVVSFDPLSLRVVRRSVDLVASSRGAVLIDQALWISDFKYGGVIEVVLPDLVQNRTLSLDAQRVLADEPAGLAVVAGNRFVVSSTGHWGGVWLVEPTADGIGAVLSTAMYFDGYATPFGVARWAPDPTRALIGLTRPGPSFEALLALYSATDQRFVPGSAPLGFGPVRELTADGDTQLFALLPWSGEVVRVRVPGR